MPCSWVLIYGMETVILGSRERPVQGGEAEGGWGSGAPPQSARPGFREEEVRPLLVCVTLRTVAPAQWYLPHC